MAPLDQTDQLRKKSINALVSSLYRVHIEQVNCYHRQPYFCSSTMTTTTWFRLTFCSFGRSLLLVCCFLSFFPFRIYFVLAFAVAIPTIWATLSVCVYFRVHFCVGTFTILMNHIILPCARFTCLSCSANGVWQAKRANISNQRDNIQTTWDRWWSARWVYANGVRHRCHRLTIDSILLHGALLKFMRKIFIFFFHSFAFCSFRSFSFCFMSMYK